MQNLTKALIDAILQDIKKDAFKDPLATPDEKAFGLLLSNYFDFNGFAVLETAYAALTDCNFHSEAEAIQKIINSSDLGGN